MLLRKSDAAPSLQPPAAPGAEEAIPGPKGSDILWGFIELRKGIFNEKREKVLTNKPVGALGSMFASLSPRRVRRICIPYQIRAPSVPDYVNQFV